MAGDLLRRAQGRGGRARRLCPGLPAADLHCKLRSGSAPRVTALAAAADQKQQAATQCVRPPPRPCSRGFRFSLCRSETSDPESLGCKRRTPLRS